MTRPISDEADFVIIGTGAAGATAARVLTEAGASVLLLEEGPLLGPEDLGRGTMSAFTKLFRDQGGQVTAGPVQIPILQSVCVGGSTVINSAITWRMSEAVHASWGLADALPWREMESCYETLERELSARPTDESKLGGNGEALRDGAAKLGWQGKATHRIERDCEGSARCLEGCAGGRKQSMNHSYIPRAIAAGARLRALCRAEKISGKVVECQTAEGPVRARARKAVLVAASAIQTPVLLQKSGLNTTGVAGRHFQGHPGVAMLGLFDRPVRLWEGATQSYEITEFRDRGIKIESLNLPPEMLAARLPGVGRKLLGYLKEMDRVAVAAVPIRARGQGTITARAIRYMPEPEDVALALEGLADVGEAYLAAGAKAVLPGVYGVPEQIRDSAGLDALRHARVGAQSFSWVMTHLMGTARMGSDPRTSAVDGLGRPHGVDGVHVIDSSVFPTNLGVNPQHTIMAVSMLLARRLVGG